MNVCVPRTKTTRFFRLFGPSLFLLVSLSHLSAFCSLPPFRAASLGCFHLLLLSIVFPRSEFPCFFDLTPFTVLCFPLSPKICMWPHNPILGFFPTKLKFPPAFPSIPAMFLTSFALYQPFCPTSQPAPQRTTLSFFFPLNLNTNPRMCWRFIFLLHEFSATHRLLPVPPCVDPFDPKSRHFFFSYAHAVRCASLSYLFLLPPPLTLNAPKRNCFCNSYVCLPQALAPLRLEFLSILSWPCYLPPTPKVRCEHQYQCAIFPQLFCFHNPFFFNEKNGPQPSTNPPPRWKELMNFRSRFFLFPLSPHLRFPSLFLPILRLLNVSRHNISPGKRLSSLDYKSFFSRIDFPFSPFR